MSNAPIISNEVNTGIEQAPKIGRPNLQLIPGGEQSNPIESAMLASIARTAFIGSAYIPLVSSQLLQEQNQKVTRTYGDEARRLLIVGPDALMSDSGDLFVIKNRRAAELLGPIILERRITRASDYYEYGFFSNSSTEQNKRTTGSQAAQDLKALLVDSNGEPFIKSTGNRASSRYGMDDVLIRDLRHGKAYKTAREAHTRKVVSIFVLNGGKRPPSIAEPAAAHGARAAMRELTREGIRDADKAERFGQLNEQITALLTHRTDEYSAANPLVDRRTEARAYVVSAFANEFEGDWQLRAACKGGDASVFFSPPYEGKKHRQEREPKAKKICATCPIIEPCLERALTQKNQEDAIWGGKSKKERQAIVDAREKAAEEAAKKAAELEVAATIETQVEAPAIKTPKKRKAVTAKS